MAPKDKDLQEIYNRVFATLCVTPINFLFKWWQQPTSPSLCVYTNHQFKFQKNMNHDGPQAIMETEVEPYDKNGKGTVH